MPEINIEIMQQLMRYNLNKLYGKFGINPNHKPKESEQMTIEIEFNTLTDCFFIIDTMNIVRRDFTNEKSAIAECDRMNRISNSFSIVKGTINYSWEDKNE